MFGNGSGESVDPAQPQDTKSLWGDMFGLGSLMKVLSDPALQLHAQAMMQSIIEGANANRRMEAKLDRLLGALGHEIADINSRFPSQFHPAGPAPLLEGNGADGDRANPSAGGAVDDGSASAADRLGADGDAARGSGASAPPQFSSRIEPPSQ
jgi:hypothetical protein